MASYQNLSRNKPKVIADAISAEDVLGELMELARQEVMLIKNLRKVAREVDRSLKPARLPHR